LWSRSSAPACARLFQNLEALEEITEFIDAHTEMGKRYEFSNMRGELRQSLLRELDFKSEAANLRRLRSTLREFERLLF